MIRKVALLTALTALAVAPTANAGRAQDRPLPNVADQTIVVPSSLGGISVGQARADAEAAWGNTGECDAQTGNIGAGCNYGNPRKSGNASQLFLNDAVYAVSIGAPADNGGSKFTGPLMKIRTDKGIGLGSKLKRAAKAYPDAKLKGLALVITEGESRMQFFAGHGPKGRITQVILTSTAPLP